MHYDKFSKYISCPFLKILWTTKLPSTVNGYLQHKVCSAYYMEATPLHIFIKM